MPPAHRKAHGVYEPRLPVEDTALLNVILAIVPPLFILYYYWRQDRRRPEPKGLILRVFALGCLSVVPLAMIELALMAVVGPLPFWIKVSLEAFVVAALVEEYGKRWVVHKVAFGHQAFDEVHDGVLYTIVASLGFACLENILYSVNDPNIAILRAFTAVPMHALASGLMGYYLGMAKFAVEEAARKKLFQKGLFSAVAFHGFYDFLLMSKTILFVGILPLLIWGFTFLRKKLAHVEHLDAERLEAA